MKNVLIILLPAALNIVVACGHMPGCAAGPSARADTLRLCVEARYAGAVGWSELYGCRVMKVLYGKPEQDEFTLYTGISRAFNDPLKHEAGGFAACTLSLRLYKENDPQRSYAIIPGFKDKKGNDWELTELRP